MPTSSPTLVGTIGSGWRGSVTGWGALDPSDGSGRCDWWIGADDRWHVPADEPSLRQRCIGGTPVVETSLRVPSGDAVQRVYAVADHGGLTVFEVENRSPLPFALAVSRADLLASRSPSAVAVAEAPAGAVLYPVAHRTTLRLALAHDGRPAGVLPSSPVPASAEQVARGWRAFADRSGRIEVPDKAMVESLVAARCALALETPPDPGDDPAGYLLAVAEDGGRGDDVPIEYVAAAAESLARQHRRARSVPWDVPPALSAAAVVLRGAGEARAATDVATAMARLAPAAEAAEAAEFAGARLLAHVYGRLVQPVDGGADLLPHMPRDWYGQSVEAHNLRVAAGTVSVALRWHGTRPALLWECSSPMRLTASALDPAWSVDATTAGEALLAPPPRDHLPRTPPMR